LSAQALVSDPAPNPPLQRLPLVTLYLTERCNSRCVSCDYWRHGRVDMNLASVQRLLPSLKRLKTQVALLSGGEPLLNPGWPSMAAALRGAGLKVWLLTSGLALAKHARRAAELFDAITVSMDGVDRETYQAIRGLDAFDKVCAGIRAAAELGVAPSLRVTVQRANYRQLPRLVSLAKGLGARQVSFLAVDIANPHAFGRTDGFAGDLALRREDLPVLAEVIKTMQDEHAEDFHSGFIAESPAKLRRILEYFTAIHDLGPYPAVRCNAPEFSAVIGAALQVQPCFFITGPRSARLFDARSANGAELPAELNGSAMAQLRADIRSGKRAECATCVCSMWRQPPDFALAPATPAGASA
jgi:Fe-coproporphyrin III synthase